MSGGGGFNLADELAMAEDSECEDTGFLAPPANRASTSHSDYEGSEYGDPDEDSDAYLSERVDLHERELAELVEEFAAENTRQGVIGQFMTELRNMRGQMDVENNTRR